ncbi:hypothetical protein K3495_g402 [Podosphaera aphanis]|nr:hypothetical protein K3495_g402 [Podosphaera aphanis]
MPLEIVKLDDIYLTNSSCTSKLLAKSTAIFHSTDASFLNHDFLPAYLSTHCVWAYRSKGCRLDLQIFVNEKKVPSGASPIIESLANSLQDAEIWSSLSLSVSIDIALENKILAHSPNISIFIRHGKKKTILPSDEGIFENVNFNPPEGVSSTSFERLELELRLTTNSLNQKKFKTSDNVHETAKEIFFDQATGSSGNTVEICERQQVSEKEKDTLHSTTKCSDEYVCHNIPSSTQIQSWLRSNEKYSLELPAILNIDDKVFQLAQKIDPDLAQWSSSFQRELNSKLTQNNGEIISNDYKSSQSSGTFPMIRDISEENVTVDEDEMLLSQNNSNALMSYSESSENDFFLLEASESKTSLTHSPQSTKRLFQDCDQVDPEEEEDYQNSACLMFETALYLVIIGTNGWVHKKFCNFKLEKPHPDKSLATCVPVLFSLNFLQSMEYNAQYILTITHSFSGFLFENAQSPSLRKKLVNISHQNFQGDQKNLSWDQLGDLDKAKTLMTTLQASLWRIMQNKLYNSAANKKLWTEILSSVKFKRGSKSCFQENEKDERIDWTENISKDNDFDDLFEDQREIVCLNDRRGLRLEESDKDEMLLGDRYGDSLKSFDEVSLLYDLSDEEIMLI